MLQMLRPEQAIAQGVLKNLELIVVARRKATKQTRNHASTWVNGVLLGGNVVWIASLRSQ
jgi:hypothetical protein